MSERPTAVIFRKRLLPWSETFIAQQGKALRRYHPLFAGYAYREGGRSYLDGADTAVLTDHARMPLLAKGFAKATGRLPRGWKGALAAHDPAIVHAHFGVNAKAASAISRSFGVPLVVTYHGMDITVDRDGAGERRREKVFAMADRIIAVSDFIRGRLLEAGAPEEKVVRHRIGVDMEYFSPGPAEDDPTGGRDPRTILFVGRLVPKKGLDHLLRAMPIVRAAVPDATLVVAGDGPLRGRLEEESARVGAEARFLGVQTPEQVRDLMRRAAVFAAPSVVAGDGNAEGLPMTIVEAQACGLPIVGFPSGGSAEGVVEGVTGFMLPPGDERALGERLADLLSDTDALRRMGSAARAHAVNEFSLQRQTARLEDLYDEVRGLSS